MERDEAIKLIKEKVKDDKLIKHMLAVEACMIKLAEHFGADTDRWSLAGILHDIDYEETKNKPEEHGIRGAQFLSEKGISEDIIEAVRIHAGHDEPESKMEISLIAADSISGLIVAGALVHPDGLSEMNTDFVLRRFDEKQFAAGANRENIMLCEKMGLNLEDFTSLCLSGMQEISDVLGL